jgi:hypothetical protein
MLARLSAGDFVVNTQRKIFFVLIFTSAKIVMPGASAAMNLMIRRQVMALLAVLQIAYRTPFTK